FPFSIAQAVVAPRAPPSFPTRRSSDLSLCCVSIEPPPIHYENHWVRHAMNYGIAGKKAIVCAASRGLGKGCAIALAQEGVDLLIDRKSTRLNSSHVKTSYAVVCLKKKT